MLRKLRVYPRKQLYFNFSDLLAALFYIPACNSKSPKICAEVESLWSSQNDALVAYSVRSGFDAYLQALALPTGSEVIMSGISIPDMVKIVRKHGLNVVPVDLDMEVLQVKTKLLEKAITAKTRLVVIAPLYGTQMNLDPVFDITEKHADIAVVEDCAQAFIGCGEYCGHPKSDISMYSFGSIKTASALGGALLRVRNPEILKTMRELMTHYPLSGRAYFLKRLMKYFALKLLSLPLPYGIFVRTFTLFGLDFDSCITAAVRSYSGEDLLLQVRKQLPVALLALLRRQLTQFKKSQLAGRIAAGRLAVKELRPYVTIPGINNETHTFWLFPVLFPNPQLLVSELREHGFDATASTVQLQAIRSDTESVGPPYECIRCVENTVYLPVYEEMSHTALERMLEIVKQLNSKPT